MFRKSRLLLNRFHPVIDNGSGFLKHQGISGHSRPRMSAHGSDSRNPPRNACRRDRIRRDLRVRIRMRMVGQSEAKERPIHIHSARAVPKDNPRRQSTSRDGDDCSDETHQQKKSPARLGSPWDKQIAPSTDKTPENTGDPRLRLSDRASIRKVTQGFPTFERFPHSFRKAHLIQATTRQICA